MTSHKIGFDTNSAPLVTHLENNPRGWLVP
jgi:hypothetical protein